jgi:mono/diheme cytochrome c family protein
MPMADRTRRIAGSERYSEATMRSLCFIVVMGLTVFAAAQDQQPEVKHTSAKPTSPASGKEMFVAYCSTCHGKDAKGDGPAASALKVPPADLTMLAKKYGGKYPSAKVTTILTGQADLAAHGNKEMPVWGPIFFQMSQGHESEVQMRIANLNHYVESLQAK